jgi:hypothetical protein
VQPHQRGVKHISHPPSLLLRASRIKPAGRCVASSGGIQDVSCFPTYATPAESLPRAAISARRRGI